MHSEGKVKTSFQLELKLQVKPLSQVDFPNVLRIINGLIFPKQIPNVPLARMPKHFVMNWQKVTSNPVILINVTGYKIRLL